MITRLPDETSKIDKKAIDGLTGVTDSLSYGIETLRNHNHSLERWFGISADQSGTDWALEDTTNNYRAISGAGVYGADANDEAKVIGTGDGPLVTGGVQFDLHRIFFLALSTDTIWTIRVIWDVTSMANGISNDRFSTVMLMNNPSGNKASGLPAALQVPQLTWGTDMVWIQAKNATDNATADFYIGVHEYTG